MLEGTIRRLADMQVMKQLSVDDLVKLRPDIGELIVGPPIVGPVIVGGAGTPAPISTALPGVPGDVRPGDLIEAADWNAVLARLRALDAVLAALAQGTARLTGRVNDLARRVPADAGGVEVATKPDRDIMVDFLGSRAIREAIAADADLLTALAKSATVTDAVKNDLDLLTVPVLNRAAGPVGPEVEGAPPVMLGFTEAETAVMKAKLEGNAVFAGLLKADESIAEGLGFTALAADVAKAGAAKAATSKTKPAGGGG
jgi:hypothetical protein